MSIYPPQPTGELREDELIWLGLQPFLEKHGYMLRPRYRPGWKPSWESNKKINPRLAEDSILLPLFGGMIDATRIADGRPVFIKMVLTDGSEQRIACMFSEKDKRDHPDNHAVPVLDTFVDEDDPTTTYMVMPLLRPIDEPPFEYIMDVVDFVDQMLKGLVYMHRLGVAHRDCAMPNIHMDASSMYPKGFHPVLRYTLPDAYYEAHPLPRFAAPTPVKYYFIDFGISVHDRHGPENATPVLGLDGIDHQVPELSLMLPYDPFKVDIFILGNLITKECYVKYSNVDFLFPLVRAMLRQDPDTRLDAESALRQWQQIRDELPSRRRLARLRETQERPIKACVLDVVYFVRLASYAARSLVLKAARKAVTCIV